MARYDHLPIYRAAFDLAVHLERTVRHFDRYHKYTLGTDLRTGSRRIRAGGDRRRLLAQRHRLTHRVDSSAARLSRAG